MLLILAFVPSSFLDNIAAAMIGGIVAKHGFGDRVHIGYIAAIVAASNAGGAGSAVGDTTTTMMWIAGVGPLDVVHACFASFVALAIISVPASLAQQKEQPIQARANARIYIDWGLGFVSAVFGTLPLTAPALGQGGYDWGMLAFEVGGSMMGFGSSAGLAITSIFPDAKSVSKWVTQGGFLILA